MDIEIESDFNKLRNAHEEEMFDNVAINDTALSEKHGNSRTGDQLHPLNVKRKKSQSRKKDDSIEINIGNYVNMQGMNPSDGGSMGAQVELHNQYQ